LVLFLVWPFFRLLIVSQSQQQKRQEYKQCRKRRILEQSGSLFLSLKKIRQKEKLEIKKLVKEATLEGFDCQFK